jgi:hypothetical protein
MGLDASVLERQLERAEAKLKACVEGLKSRNVDEAEWRRCPDWRNADADRRQAKRRLSAAKALRERAPATDEAAGEDE